ncbi:MAG: hypothetical protein ACREDF_06985, partial [Thermoplasmata archaeon]
MSRNTFTALRLDSSPPRSTSVRSLSFTFGQLTAPLLGLLGEFRLIVNKSIRIALHEDIRSRYRLTKAAYRILSDEH